MKMREMKRIELSGWGRYPRAVNSVFMPSTLDEAAVKSNGRVIARGQGRSYGDAAMLKDGIVMLSERLDRVIAFDEKTGILTAEAGLTLEQVLRDFVPKGWFLPVSPGTAYVSLGGCLAADVHGKNHHRDGAFGQHVVEFNLAVADGRVIRCSRDEHPELFWATIGGMGLTGIITTLSLRLIPIESASIISQHLQANDLDASLELMESKQWDDAYTVAWIDCLSGGKDLGRSVFMRGHHATLQELPARARTKPLQVKLRGQRNVPFDLPSFALNSIAMKGFNKVYYRVQRGKRAPFVTDYQSFFHPLDRVGNWNRAYGRGGFVQYQLVLPPAQARTGLLQVIEELRRNRRSSFLSVLKRFGPEGRGLLSFPMEGYTLTLDIPVRGAGLLPFLDRLDEIVLKFGGRVYLAKDARLRPENFRAMYSRFREWQQIKAKVDPENHFASDLSRRLEMHKQTK
jgi:decaprenylphospho-beta-D-ribofuranose 2-oxidase